MVWEVDGGSSFLSQNERTAHFGLGQFEGTVDLVTIEWTSGIVEHLYDIAANQTLTVVEGDTCPPCEGVRPAGDLDASGQVDAGDLNLVLFNWNKLGSELAPDAWTHNRPANDARVDAAHLNQVLFTWNESFPSNPQVPEPSAVAIVFGLGIVAALLLDPRRRRGV